MQTFDEQYKEEIGKTLKILIEKVFTAMREGKSFIFSGVVDDGGTLPYVIGGASPNGNIKVLERFKDSNKALINHLLGIADGIEAMMKAEQEAIKPKIVKQEDQAGGFVKIEKSEDGSVIIKLDRR